MSLCKATLFCEVSILIAGLKARNTQMQFVETLHSQWLWAGVVTDTWVSKDGGSILDFPSKSSKTHCKKQNRETGWLQGFSLQ